MNSTNNTLNIDELIDESIDLAILSTLLELQGNSTPLEPQKRFLSRNQGQHYVNKLLNSSHFDCIYAVIRMSKETFYSLRDWLVQNMYLKSSRYISIEQKLLIFLHITSRPATNHNTMERFLHSNSTISK